MTNAGAKYLVSADGKELGRFTGRQIRTKLFRKTKCIFASTFPLAKPSAFWPTASATVSSRTASAGLVPFKRLLQNFQSAFRARNDTSMATIATVAIA
jgi:hypothetical protein